MSHFLGMNVDHTFLPNVLFAFSSSVFGTWTAGKVGTHYFHVLPGGEPERGGAHQGDGFRGE